MLTVLVLGGVATAIGENMAGRGETPPPAETASVESKAESSATPSPTATEDVAAGAPVVGGLVPSDAGALRDAINAAVAAAGGAGATEIDVEANGYEVEVQRADGTEAEVFVSLDGSTAVRDEDDDDDDPLINLDQLPDLVRIALETAGGGVIEQISTDDDDDHFYDVDVLLENGAEVEIEFDAALNVIEVERS